jgi:hypothetical protein
VLGPTSHPDGERFRILLPHVDEHAPHKVGIAHVRLPVLPDRKRIRRFRRSAAFPAVQLGKALPRRVRGPVDFLALLALAASSRGVKTGRLRRDIRRSLFRQPVSSILLSSNTGQVLQQLLNKQNGRSGVHISAV